VFLEKTLNAVYHGGAKQSARCGGPADERHANRTAWSGMTDREHSKKSCS